MRWARIALRIILALLAFGVLAASTAREVGWLGRDPFWEFWPVVVVGVAVLAESISGAVGELRRPAREAYAARVRTIAVGLSKTVAEMTGVSPFDVGVSVYVTRRKRLLLPPRLERVVRQRLSNSPLPSGITWTKEKGAVGQAWSLSRHVHVDWTPMITEWNGTSRDEAAFAQLAEAVQSGLTFEEFCRVVDKYGEILATPILEENGEHCYGVVAMELPHTVEHVGMLLDSPGVREASAQAAALLRGVIGRG